jgi:hypothetical protein
MKENEDRWGHTKTKNFLTWLQYNLKSENIF